MCWKPCRPILLFYLFHTSPGRKIHLHLFYLCWLVPKICLRRFLIGIVLGLSGRNQACLRDKIQHWHMVLFVNLRLLFELLRLSNLWNRIWRNRECMLGLLKFWFRHMLLWCRLRSWLSCMVSLCSNQLGKCWMLEANCDLRWLQLE